MELSAIGKDLNIQVDIWKWNYFLLICVQGGSGSGGGWRGWEL